MAARDKLFANKAKVCEIPDYGTFHVRVIDGEQMLAQNQRVRDFAKPGCNITELDIYAGIVCVAAADEDGARLFTDEEMPRVRTLPYPVLLALSDAARKLNFPEETEVKKNSETPPTWISSTPWPLPSA